MTQSLFWTNNPSNILHYYGFDTERNRFITALLAFFGIPNRKAVSVKDILKTFETNSNKFHGTQLSRRTGRTRSNLVQI